MGPRALLRFARLRTPDAPLSPAEEQALDERLAAFARERHPFDASAGWARLESRLDDAPGGRRLPALALPSLAASTSRVAAGAVTAVVMVAAITVSAVLFSGDNSARAEFFDAVDDLETLSIDALADGVLTSEEAATLNAQAAMVEQVLESDVDAVANSSADEHSNALDALGEVRERLAERAVGDEEAGPTANAVIVLERVSAKLADPTHGAGRPDEPGRSGERGRGEGNSGQGQGNAPQGTESNANLGGDSNSAPAEDDTDANPGRGRGRS